MTIMPTSQTHLQQILTPLDGSPFSEDALPLACEIARRSAARLRLVHVHALSPSPIYMEGQPVIDENLASLSREHGRIYLEKTRERLITTHGTGIDIAIEFVDRSIQSLMNEPLGSFLANYAASSQTDLIVMTTHSRGGMGRRWLGSVADTLVRLSQIPILLLRPHDSTPDFVAPQLFTKILIPLDGSQLAEQILKPALALGDLAQAEYFLLRVEQSPAQNAEAKAYLDGLAQQLAGEGRGFQTGVTVAAQPASAILEIAQQEGSDLIALATHGRSGFRRLLIGSVADKVLRGASTPILIYRPQTGQAED
jgi:nucleotide-binding universal stress UspA family protein